MADQRLRIDPDAAQPRHGSRDQAGLIVSARPKPPAVKRNRHQQVDVGSQVARHQSRRRLGESSPPAIFEAQRHGARDLPIRDGGVYPAMPRRRLEARSTPCAGRRFIAQRRVTGRAPWRAEEAQRSPACCAEAMIVIGNRAASRASWGQSQRNHWLKQLGEHRPRLSRAAAGRTSRAMTAPEIFDRKARRTRRDRIAPRFAAHDFVRAAMLDGIHERLASVKRSFHDVLDLGSFDGSFQPPAGARIARLDAGHGFARQAGGVQADEDRLPFADHSFDLVVSAGVLDQVNDVPGALSLIRRILRPDGLFLGAFLGAGSLATLRSAMRSAEAERPVARFHPQIDVRSAGDLLMRAGFALPVADAEPLRVRYGNVGRLFDDLRGMAGTNLLIDRQPLGAATVARSAAAFADLADADGRTAERFEIIFLTGWAPSPDQPQPARRGSATASLAATLRPPG